MATPLDPALDLDLVARFVRVAEARSFAAAALRTKLPKSTLSRSVTRLEQSLGVRLLERTTRSVRLTDEGLRLFETASRGLATIGEALDLASDSPTQLRGSLRITAPPDLGNLLVAEMVARFTALHPEVKIEVDLSGRIVDLVKDGFDAAFRAGQLRDSSLVARKLCGFGAGIYVSPAVAAKHPVPKKPADLEALPFVLFRPAQGEQRIVLKSPKASARITVRGSVASDDLAFVHRSCLAGAGYAWLPTFAGEPGVAEGTLQRALPTFESNAGGLYLVYPSSRLAPARLVALRDFAVAYFADKRL